MERDLIIAWLSESHEDRLAELWRSAESARRRFVGASIHLRGLVEISNHCACRCTYCGLAADITDLRRYRMSDREILEAAAECRRRGYGTLVIQAGEDPGLKAERIATLIERIKSAQGLAITLSLGERPAADLQMWRDAGADRYLLKQETGSAAQYDALHPGRTGGHARRSAVLGVLRDQGYEIGSGLMVGLPGESIGDIADGLLMLRDLDPDMISVGPYLPHPDTPSGRRFVAGGGDTALNVSLCYKAMALARLLCPETNMPCTTSLSVAAGEAGRLAGLARGANVVMLNLTPDAYSGDYRIYPSPARRCDAAPDQHDTVIEQIDALGCSVSRDHGASTRYLRRHEHA